MQKRTMVALSVNLGAEFISEMSATVTLIAVALLPSLGVSRPLAPSLQDDVLARPAATSGQSLPAFSAFEDALQVSGVPGGMAFVERCADETKPVVHPHGTTLRQVLDSIISADPHYIWRVRKGVVNLEPVKGVPALLKTPLVSYDSGEVTDAVSAVSILSSSPDVVRAGARLGLTHNALGPGLGGMAPVSPQPQKPLGLRLHDAPLLDALNAIARANKHGVWTYRETQCGSVRQFNISFAQ